MNWEAAVRSLIDDPSKRALVEACYFDPPLARAACRYADGPEWREIVKYISKPDPTADRRKRLAVDIGAGNGIVSFALARDGWATTAIEPDPSELVGAGAIRRLARETGLDIDVRDAVGEMLPIETASVDLVIARQVLHHARDLPAFCREIARVLVPGGQLIALRDHVISGPSQMQPFLDAHPLHRHYGGENAFALSEYRSALMGAGLTIEYELGPLASVINYAPNTLETLRSEIAQRLGVFSFLAAGLRPAFVMRAILGIVSKLDNRPGRLVSFICRKPS